ncbi:hypothetical protein [Anabaena sp. AL93]|jgi:hypothetical protein|nr:hypothetical protein [Anabaena sp. AL93]MCX5982572.1 hypothetical protein [Nostocales cyanobacterium LacPavin_0920_SED1_MAG_38_18]
MPLLIGEKMGDSEALRRTQVSPIAMQLIQQKLGEIGEQGQELLQKYLAV